MKKYILPAVLLAAGFSLSTIGFQKQEIKAAEEIGTEVEETSTEQVKISPTEANQMAWHYILPVRLFTKKQNGSFRPLCRKICL